MNSLKKFDNNFIEGTVKLLAGTDEAGRGPIAGPVVAAAVIFDDKTFREQINDSKKLTEKKRDELFEWSTSNCVSYGISIVDHIEIDAINILQASLKAMENAVAQLNVKPDLILIDGNKTFLSNIPTKPIVKGDAKSFSIAAASILAKVTRDKIMLEASEKFPVYSWHMNKGYPTKKHIEAVRNFGITPLHRKTFLSKIL